MVFFMSPVDASNADDGGSGGEAEEPAVNLPAINHGFASDADNECSSSEKADTDLSDKDSNSEESEDDLSSKESDNNIPQQPLTTSRTPPLVFPMSPIPDPHAQPHEAVSDDGFHNNNDYDDISGWYMTEEEV